MSASRRALELACYAAAAVWIGAYLAWSAREIDLAVDPPNAIAHIQPRAEPPPAPPPEPALARESPPAPEKRLEPTRIGRADISKGSRLLDDGADFPVLSCRYDDFPSFREYARAMVALGARFVVVRKREIVGAIDVETGRVDERALDAAFSPRARDYTGEPELAGPAATARERFGDGAVVMMLVPRSLDAGLFGGIARVLSERGERHADFREIRGRYERAGADSVQLRVEEGVRADGTAMAMELLFDLSEIARIGA